MARASAVKSDVKKLEPPLLLLLLLPCMMPPPTLPLPNPDAEAATEVAALADWLGATEAAWTDDAAAAAAAADDEDEDEGADG
jgi:hypothetical protein